ncbi:hypothetical protein BH23VER1_BH23VER1_24090 [soil metagenome]
MPRQVRIEFPGAVYHVVARGDRREPIFLDEGDHGFFLATLAKACERTGWLVHAYALIRNHYHLVVETPEANLSAGMGWLQNTYTRRLNVKHDLWGHVFGGRYRAILVQADDPDYFGRLVDYVHLNPVRAGLVPAGGDLTEFPWTSLASYLEPPRKRPAWLRSGRALEWCGQTDSASGRRRYLTHLESRVAEEAERAGTALPDGQSLQSTLRRGWFFGSEEFRERVLKFAAATMGSKVGKPDYAASSEMRSHGVGRAEAILEAGLRETDLHGADLAKIPKTDPRKCLVALVIKSETTVPLSWIADRLCMGVCSNVSRGVKDLERTLETDTPTANTVARLRQR